MENFEALGRYITAKEKAEEFARERSGHLSKAKRFIEQYSQSGGYQYVACDFDPTKIQESISKAAEAHSNLLAAVHEANLHAEECGKPKLEIYKIPTY